MIKVLFVLRKAVFLIILLSSLFLSAQQQPLVHADSITHWLSIARNYSINGDFDNCNLYFTKVQTQIDSLTRKDQAIDSSCISKFLSLSGQYSSVLYKQKKYKKVIQLTKTSILLLSKYPLKTDSSIAAIYYYYGNSQSKDGSRFEAIPPLLKAVEYYQKEESVNINRLYKSEWSLATCYGFVGKFDTSLIFINRTLSHFESPDSSLTLNKARLIALKALIISSMGNNFDALELFKVSIGIFDSIKSDYSENDITILCNMGVAYEGLNDFTNALKIYIKAREKLIGMNNPDSYLLAHVYHIMSIPYSRTDQPKQAILSLNRAIDLLENKAEEDVDAAHSLVGCYWELGNNYTVLEEYKEACNYLTKAIDLSNKVFGMTHISTLFSFLSRAWFYSEQSEYDKAISDFNTAISIADNLLTKDDIQYSYIYSKIGDMYLIQSSPDSAIFYFEKALSIENIAGEKNNISDIIQTNRKLGKAYLLKHDFHKSLQCFETGFKTAGLTDGSDFSVKLDSLVVYSSLGRNQLVNLIWGRAMARRKLLEGTEIKDEKWFNEMTNILDQFKICNTLIQDERQRLVFKFDKLEMGKLAYPFYLDAMQTAMICYHESKDGIFLQQAYYYASKSKSFSLLESLLQQDFLNSGSLPDSIAKKEYQLQMDILMNEQWLANSNDKNIQVSAHEKLLYLYERYREFVSNLKQDNPEYYNYIYIDSITSLQQVSQAVTDSKTAILDYYLCDTTLYIFTITQNGYSVKEVIVNSSFTKDLKAFTSSLKTFNASDYTNLAMKLYKSLIYSIENQVNGIEHLVIIPTGEMSLFPFEALISKPIVRSGDVPDFTKLQYLVKRFSISYYYSTPLYIRASKSDLIRKKIIAFAPVFSDRFSPGGNTLAWRSKTGTSKLNALPASLNEVTNIENLFNNQSDSSITFIGEKATKRNFLVNAANYPIIHLASHSFADNNDPGLSKIAFTSLDTIGNVKEGADFLYAGDIYSLKLNADLVVLSSCESGVGKMVKGEGMLALTRGFFYAGCKNILHSLWRVYDKTTSTLMQSFYKSLVNGETVSNSLQQAKINLIFNPETANPGLWSSFILMGK